MSKTNLGLAVISVISAVILSGCGSITRVEQDVYTLTHIDTIRAERVQNAPSDRDNGVIYPSSRTVQLTRTLKQRDSIVVREYPDFIRLGVFEGIGLIGSGSGGNSVNLGLFGMFMDIDQAITGRPTTGSALFTGSIHRFGIGEWRLRLFDDAPGWSWGVIGAELIRGDDRSDNWLTGAGVLTVTKRFYFKETIPYGSFRISAGFSVIPSQYVHLTTSADIGSIGGLNLRAYTGLAVGMGGLVQAGSSVVMPYVGLGASLLDFVNREPELEREWKDMEHSAWHLGIADITLIGSDVTASLFDPSSTAGKVPLITGLIARVAPVTLAIPILDNRFSIGTAAANFVALGNTAFGLGVLPIRLSYFAYPIYDKVLLEPFIEMNYAPSTFAHIGIRGAMPVNDQVSVHVQFGYANGSTGSVRGLTVEGRDVNLTSFSGIYFGVGLGFMDYFFTAKELRYEKK